MSSFQDYPTLTPSSDSIWSFWNYLLQGTLLQGISQMWRDVTIVARCYQFTTYLIQLLKIPTSVTPVTQYSYSGYPIELLLLPNPVTPVTQSSYSSYLIQLLKIPTPVTPVTQSTYSSYPTQLLQFPTPVTQSS